VHLVHQEQSITTLTFGHPWQDKNFSQRFQKLLLVSEKKLEGLSWIYNIEKFF
jgi:hypothetical protein